MIKAYLTELLLQDFGNINKSCKVRKIEKKLKREQRSLSRKILKRKRGGVAAKTRVNIDKNTLRVQSLHLRLSDIREEYIKSVVNTLVKSADGSGQN